MDQGKVRINIDYLRPNSKIIFPLYSEGGEKVIDERVVLTSHKIDEIKKKFGHFVYGLEDEDYGAISKKVIDKAVDRSKDIIEEISTSEKLTKTAYNEAEKVVEDIISDLDSAEIEAIKLLKSLKSFEEYVYQHSVNVGIIAAVFAKMTGRFSPEQIKFLTLGAYLLDIGLIRIDKLLLKKNGKYSFHDMQKMKQHPQFGYEILKNIPGIDPIVLQTLLFHHEKINYKGYYQLPYDMLPISPKIVSVCDVYDALTTPRPYRKAITPTNALKFLVNSINIYYDYQLISDFVNYLGPLLNNTQSFYSRKDFCELNTKELAMIMDFSMTDYMKPKVMVFCKFKKTKTKILVQFYDNPIEVNLEEDRKRLITKIINNKNQIRLIKKKLIEKKMIARLYSS